MKITRKDFLRLSGLGLLAVAGKKAVRAITEAAPSASTPKKTKQWGMVIDLAKCRQEAGCTDCIKACNTAHNIPQIADPAREIKWIWNQPFETVFPLLKTDYTKQAYTGHPITVLCNHCANPPCVRVCPTQATWKRDEDGIVMMDWHRCIGCRYCMAACPYGSRSFNWQDPRLAIASFNPDFPTRTKGVVEKCNFCEERLARGKRPACVEACPEKTIVFGDLLDPDSEPRQLLRTRFSLQREPELGTSPSVYYLV
jgi:molybdopterin-containing oxidoreductase family iron-sulfur binding subunit